MSTKLVIIRKPHSLRERLRSNGVSVAAAAAFLGERYSTVSSWLQAYHPMPIAVEARLTDLVEAAEAGRVIMGVADE